MRMLVTAILFGVTLAGSGCTFVHNIQRTLIRSPLQAFDDKIEIQRHERLGRMAWDEMVRQYGCQFSDDYRDGFIDGFVDYLTFGGCASGNGEAPVIPSVPPPRYRRAKAESPLGLQASEDWFAGFRHGSNTALASGLRQLAVVPVFDKPAFLDSSQYGSTSKTGASAGKKEPPQTQPTPEGEQLPPPRVINPEPGEAKPPADKPPANPPATPPVAPPGPPPAALPEKPQPDLPPAVTPPSGPPPAMTLPSSPE